MAVPVCRFNPSIAAVPVAGATTLAGYRPATSLSATPDQYTVAQLLNIIQAYNAVLQKAQQQGWTAAQVAAVKAQRQPYVDALTAKNQQLNQRDQPSGFLTTLSATGDQLAADLAGIQGLAGILKYLPVLALGLGGLWVWSMLPKRRVA